jgi:cellulose synthase/poly-beta-1,6-N-acetylglucosamine synthase-like glycosyltransferase
VIPSQATAPTFSIVIPTRGRPDELAECLKGLAGLDLPGGRVETIVVVDGGDPAAELVAARADGPSMLRVVAREWGGAPAARNTGAEHADGRFLAFIDDDCVPAPGWLAALSRRFAEDADVALGGRTLNAATGNPYSTASQAVLDAAYAHWNSRGSRPRFFASNNLALPADGFWALGGFDTSYAPVGGEDRDLCARWIESGRHMSYVPDALVHHLKQLTLSAFVRQHFRYGRGARRFHRSRVLRGGGRNIPEPGFYVELARQGGAHAGGLGRIPMAALLATSQIANAAGYLLELRNGGATKGASPT